MITVETTHTFALGSGLSLVGSQQTWCMPSVLMLSVQLQAAQEEEAADEDENPDKAEEKAADKADSKDADAVDTAEAPQEVGPSTAAAEGSQTVAEAADGTGTDATATAAAGTKTAAAGGTGGTDAQTDKEGKPAEAAEGGVEAAADPGNNLPQQGLSVMDGFELELVHDIDIE